MKKIAVFTSGGDAPGMNAAIRAVVRSAIFYKVGVAGIMRGYDGMIAGDFIPLSSPSVANIIQRGGTILKTARSEEFRTKEGRAEAFRKLQEHGVEGIVAIGGNGTFAGAEIFYREFGIPSIGLPGTIDNDLYGTDYTIGFDTAINTGLDAIDRIRDTADSHDRIFFVEVMGRDSGFIAVEVGVSGGAEAMLIPETKTTLDQLVDMFNQQSKRKKTFSIIIVAEGDEEGNAYDIVKKLQGRIPDFDPRVTILGHIQRGGKPTAYDRMLATRLGVAAVEALLKGEKNQMAGIINQEVAFTSFRDAIEKKKQISPSILRLTEILNV
jgi:6-phosphofructokinase 1